MTERITDAHSAYYKDRNTWVRGFFMLLFVAIYYVAMFLMVPLVIVQFGWKVVTGETNPRLQSFGEALSRFIYQIMRFQTFNTEDKPYPFEDWPAAGPKD